MENVFTLQDRTTLDSVRSVLRQLLESGAVNAVLVSLRSAAGTVMPALVSDPEQIHGADPLGPCFPLNGARLVSKMTRASLGQKTGVVLRPCEVRALVELVKIHQASLDDLVIISFDCPGAFSNADFRLQAQERGEAFTHDFLAQRISSLFSHDSQDALTAACRICTQPFPVMADIALELLGWDNSSIGVRPASDAGRSILRELNLTQRQPVQGRDEMISRLLTRQATRRQEVSSRVHGATATLETLSTYLAACVNCYNCRVACPVCFCRECVFNTDVFDYEPFQYASWSKARGQLRMPLDTVFFHLTRMVHMGLSCIGCGQCSNACPNNIPLSELFISTGDAAQQGFGYQPGVSLEDAPPLSVFHDSEFQEVTGV